MLTDAPWPSTGNPSYGAPRDNLWTRQTKAHNGILVNGRGQPPHTWQADGQIQSFERQGAITLVRGQAANAYNVPQPASIARLWNKFLKEPIPPMDPKVQTFERALAPVASKSRPVLVVHDYLKTSAPATFDWLLQALNRMETDSQSGSITIREGDARLAARLVSTMPFRFAQRTGFPVQPEAVTNTAYVLSEAKFPNQWHLRAGAESPTGEMKFLAVMVPYRATEAEAEIAPLKSEDVVGFRVAGTEVAAWWGAGYQGKISVAGLTGEGRMIVRVAEEGRTVQVVSQ